MVVSNSSPLVYLAALDDFDLLRALFGEVAIPLAVFQEVAVDGAQFPVARQVIGAQGNWIHTPRRPDDSRAAEFRKAGLHSGESEALALALELQSEALLMDDGDAVKIARELGINVIRTTGIYRLAKQRGLIERLAPKLDKLKGAGFWLRDEHYRMIWTALANDRSQTRDSNQRSPRELQGPTPVTAMAQVNNSCCVPLRGFE